MAELPSREDSERRIASLVAASEAARDRDPPPAVDEPDSLPAPGYDGEDFLFHLYRGSELLQDNCFNEAREELERALGFQPRDVEGQGLLGVVYFRLGMYPRAIQIYEDIIRACPSELTPRVNLALCYLKTGQNLLAREHLEEVIRKLPDHRRAWGYLGLVYERMGDTEKALAAFEHAKQPQMARRMQQLLDAQRGGDARDTALRAERAELAAAAADAVQEIEGEADPSPFRRAESAGTPTGGSGRWRAVELGEEHLPPPRPVPSLVGRLGPAVPAVSESMAPSKLPTSAPVVRSGPLRPEELVAESALSTETAPGVTIEAEGTAIVTVDGAFAVRVDALRALSPERGAFKSSNLVRHARGRDLDEPVGGVATPLVLLEGQGAIVVRQRSPGPARLMVAVWLDREFLYAREEALIGFDGALRHESGRLSLGAGRHVPMIQLSGRGAVLLEPKSALRSLGVRAEKRVVVRGEDVLGWTGRLLPQPAGPEDAPASVSGFVAFSGDGSLLLDPGA